MKEFFVGLTFILIVSCLLTTLTIPLYSSNLIIKISQYIGNGLIITAFVLIIGYIIYCIGKYIMD